MDISVLYIIPNDRIIETVQRVMQRCDVNYPVYYGTMSGALEIAKRMIAQGSRVIVSTGLTALYLRKHLSVPVLELLFTNTEFARAIQEGLAFSDKPATAFPCLGRPQLHQRPQARRQDTSLYRVSWPLQ